MIKLLLAGTILFAMTACDERVGRGIKVPTPMPLTMQTQKPVEVQAPVHVEPVQKEELPVLNAVPILEDELPTLPTPVNIKESVAVEKGFTKPKVTDNNAFDIANIRISNSPKRTRIVLDSYTSGVKSSMAAAYTYSYNAPKKSITLTLNGYDHISALGKDKELTYHGMSVKNITLDSTEASTIKCVIALKKDSDIKVFDIKEPGRIVIDILPR